MISFKSINWKLILPILAFCIILIANIILLSTKVFKGKYVGSNSRWDFELTLYDNNTYALQSTLKSPSNIEHGGTYTFYGFYHIENNEITLLRSEFNTSSQKNNGTAVRKSVFKIDFNDGSLTSIELTCYPAVFLQLFYGVVLFLSAIFGIRQLLIYERRKS